MNILDLKKLMLVPLVCCTSMQQVNADVIETNTELNTLGDANDSQQTSWFIEKIRKLSLRGRDNGLSDNLCVAPDIAQNGIHDMGGIALFVPTTKDKCNPPKFYQAVKIHPNQQIVIPNTNPENGGDLLYPRPKENIDFLHTERQLSIAIFNNKAAHDGGAVHIYTYKMPCSNRKNGNGHFSCCDYYIALAKKFPKINFHIYTRFPDIESMKSYIMCYNKQELIVLSRLFGNYYATLIKLRLPNYNTTDLIKQYIKELFNYANIQNNITQEQCIEITTHILALLSDINLGKDLHFDEFYKCLMQARSNNNNLKNIQFHFLDIQLPNR